MEDDLKPKIDGGPAAFLEKLATDLAGTFRNDRDLVSILKVHILNTAPAKDAVSQAKSEILDLAVKRASSPRTEEVSNG
jgi:hypothetical protein